MKRRSFIASLFANAAAPVVAKAIPAVTVPVVGKIEGPESVGRYEAVESHDADGPIVLSGNVVINVPNIERINVTSADPAYGSQWLTPVDAPLVYRISCECISDLSRIANFDPMERLAFSIREKGFNGFIAGSVKAFELKADPDMPMRFTVAIESDRRIEVLNASPTTEAMC